MKVKVINKSGMDLPAYATLAAAGMDVRAAVDTPVTLAPMGRAVVPTGLYLEIPVGYEVQVRPRSGLAAKQGLRPANCVGVCDSDYRGELCSVMQANADFFIPFSRARVTVVWSQTEAGPKYWMAPG